MPLEEHDPALAGLEAALAALAPTPGRIDRDALLFRAGQVSVRSRGWFWPGAAAALGVLAATLGALLIYTPPPAPVVRTVYVRAQDPASSLPSPVADSESTPPVAYAPGSPEPTVAARESPMNYVQLEKQIMRWGLEGMPDTPEAVPSSVQPLTQDSLRGTPAAPASFTSFFDLHSIFQ
jgi:hypothetical protein